MDVNYLSEQRESLQIICFKLEDTHFASDIQMVKEIITMMDIRPIPRSPDFVKGVINLRGQIIPVVDLRKQFGLKSFQTEKDSKIIIFNHDSRFVGFIVDEVSQVIRKASKEIMAPPPIMMIGIDSRCILGVFTDGKKYTLLLDLTKAFSEEEAQLLESILGQSRK